MLKYKNKRLVWADESKSPTVYELNILNKPILLCIGLKPLSNQKNWFKSRKSNSAWLTVILLHGMNGMNKHDTKLFTSFIVTV